MISCILRHYPLYTKQQKELMWILWYAERSVLMNLVSMFLYLQCGIILLDVIQKKNIEELDFFNNICSPVLWDKLIKADIVKRCLSPSLRRGQDFVTLLSYISLCNSIYFIDDSLYYYRHHKDSVMAKPESRNTIMTDFQTEKMALSILKKLFQQTKAYVFYCKRIKKEWEKRLDNNLILLNDSDIFMIRQMLSDLAPSKID